MIDVPLHPNHKTEAGAFAVKGEIALTYIPVILLELKEDAREMFAQVLQASIDAAYAQGFADGEIQGRRKGPTS